MWKAITGAALLAAAVVVAVVALKRRRPVDVKIILREGPVNIPSLGNAGIDASHPLWDGIVAHEYFPAVAGSANYVVTLTKPVSDVDQVFSAEADLVHALGLLAMAWPFAGGGSFMALETRDVVKSPRFESNAHAVRDQLLAERSLHHVSSTAAIPYESVGFYVKPPLHDAAVIARAAQASPGLRRLLEYHQNALMAYHHAPRREREAAWFVNLYKVGEALKGIHVAPPARQHRKAPTVLRTKLQISDSDWDYYGWVLNNNDLRHAELTGVVPNIPQSDVEHLFRLARDWSSAQLRLLGLPAV
jgi:hypothetical protein